jgi:hypothetical protein
MFFAAVILPVEPMKLVRLGRARHFVRAACHEDVPYLAVPGQELVIQR